MKLRNGKLSNGIELLNPATREITEHNASSSLIQSCADVKNMIFDYVISGQLIHVYGNKSSKFTTLCSAWISETQAQQDFYTAVPESLELSDQTHSLSDQTDALVYTFSREVSRHHYCQEKCSLALLHTCRQVYHELKDIIYSSNTFSFRNPAALPIFTSSLLKSSANPRFAIRSLHLDIQLCEDSDYQKWNKAIGIIPTHLPNVQRLYINLDLDRNNTNHSYLLYSKIMRASWLYQLHVLPLKEVVVIVADDDWEDSQREGEWFSTLEFRWTLSKKQEYATELRRMLLRKK